MAFDVLLARPETPESMAKEWRLDETLFSTSFSNVHSALSLNEAAVEIDRRFGSAVAQRTLDEIASELCTTGRYLKPSSAMQAKEVLRRALRDRALFVGRAFSFKAPLAPAPAQGPANFYVDPARFYVPQAVAPEPAQVDFYFEQDVDCQPLQNASLLVEVEKGQTLQLTTAGDGRLHFQSKAPKPYRILSLQGRYQVIRGKRR